MSENMDFHCPHARAVAQNLPDDELCDKIANFYKVFSDQTRIKILFCMLEHRICVHDISLMVGMSQSCVSHQLKFLRQSGLVKVEKEGRSNFYSLDDEHIHDALLLAKEHTSEV